MATGADRIMVSWDPPPLETQNGVITTYSLTCQPEELLLANHSVSYSAPGAYLLTGFSPAQTYSCSVYASTASGHGPPAVQTVTLLDDGEIINEDI